MEIFFGLKNDLRKIGLLTFDHSCRKLINLLQCFIISCNLFIYSATTLCFLIFEAVTFHDYVESFVPFIIGFLGFLLYCTLLWQRTEILKLIMEFQFMIENRKQFFNDFVYFQTNRLL